MRCARIAVGCLILALAAVPAAAQEEEQQGRGGFSRMDDLRGKTTPLNQVGQPAPASLDNVDEGYSSSFDDADTGYTETLDSVDTGHTDELDRVDTGGTYSLDSVSGGTTRSIEQTRAANRGWQPPECDGSPLESSRTPADDQLDAWDLVLGEAEKQLQDSRDRWKKLEIGSVRVRVEDRSRQEAANREARSKSREAYGTARCDLVALILMARSAGASPGTLRPYVQRLPEDLNPF